MVMERDTKGASRLSGDTGKRESVPDVSLMMKDIKPDAHVYKWLLMARVAGMPSGGVSKTADGRTDDDDGTTNDDGGGGGVDGGGRTDDDGTTNGSTGGCWYVPGTR